MRHKILQIKREQLELKRIQFKIKTNKKRTNGWKTKIFKAEKREERYNEKLKQRPTEIA